MAITLSQSRNVISIICNDFNKYWLGNSANSAKKNVSSLLSSTDNLVTITVIENLLQKLQEIIVLKDAIVQNEKDYVFWRQSYEDAKKNLQTADSSNYSYYSLVMQTANRKKTESYNALLNNKSSLDTKISGVCVRYTSIEPSYLQENYIGYAINNGPIALSNKLDLMITELENTKISTTDSKYNKVEIRCPDILGFNINIDDVRDLINSKIETLINRVKNVQKKFAHHLENIINFENGNAVSISNKGFNDTPTTTQEEKTHVLENGQTLIYVASLYGLTWQEIARANNITDTRNIPAGTVLVIPGQYETVTVQPNDDVEIIENETLPDVVPIASNIINSFSEVGRNNWDVDAAQMNAGEYDSPFYVQNNRMVDANGDIISINGYVFEGNGGKHRGIDLSGGANDYGTPIYTLGPGIVVDYQNDNGWNSGCGNYVRILHETLNEDGEVIYIISTYEHLANVPNDISVGTVVDSRDMIGTMGNSGNTQGTHLHLEITKVPGLTSEEMEGKNADEVVQIVKDNGLKFNYGHDNWINPTDYFEGQGWIN